jgi:CMP-N-acetylneuraminic acid synthetase
LQPTSPLRKFDLVHKSIKILDKEKKFDSLIHLAKDQTYSGKILNNKWIPEYSLKTRTQDINNKFKPTGNIFLYRSNLYKNKTNLPKKTFGLISNNSEYLDLDTYEDLKILKFYIKRLKKL